MRATNVRKLFKLLLAVLVTAGLAMAPLVTAAATEHSMAAAMMQMDDMAGMAADMPCCPDKQKSSDCNDCPLVAICILKVLQTGPSTSAILMRDPSRQRLHPLDDLIVDGLARPPPDHPPRYLV
jgi:hypothetical protein